jgi:hypothetical protein
MAVLRGTRKSRLKLNNSREKGMAAPPEGQNRQKKMKIRKNSLKPKEENLNKKIRRRCRTWQNRSVLLKKTCIKPGN